MIPVPKIFFTVKAESEGYTQLNVFDNCIIEAGIGDTNLVKMSSIIPVAIPVDENEAGLIMEYSAETNFNEAVKVVRAMVEKGFEKRKRKIKEIYVDGTEHRVITRGGVFAGVVLWY